MYDMYYKYKKISKEVYDYCVRMKLVDAALIAKWKKPGYERLYVLFPSGNSCLHSMCQVLHICDQHKEL